MESKELLQLLAALLDKHKVKEAVELIKKEDITRQLVNDSDLMWDTVPIIFRRLRGLNKFRFKTFGACSDILIHLAERCKPKEVLISLLSELEFDNSQAHKNEQDEEPKKSDHSDEDYCFKAVLNPTTIVMKKLPNKRSETLKWILNTLNNHVRLIDLPQEYNLDPGKERLLLETDPLMKRFSCVLMLYLDFIEYFVDELRYQKAGSSQESQYELQQCDILTRSLLMLLHHPMVYLDLTNYEAIQIENHTARRTEREKHEKTTKNNENIPNRTRETNGISMNDCSKDVRNHTANVNKLNLLKLTRNPSILDSLDAKSALKFTCNDMRVSAIKLVELITKIQPDLYKLQDRVDIMVANSPNETELVFSSVAADYSLGVMSYLVLSEELNERTTFVPRVYSHVYVLTRHLTKINRLLERRESLVYEKGLYLLNNIMRYIAHDQLDSGFIDLLRQYPIDKSLLKIMRFSSIEVHRQFALSIFRRLVDCLNNSGKYQLIYSTTCQPGQHSGIKGFALGLYKDCIIHSHFAPTFFGRNLHRLFFNVIKSSLPDGVESDLLENSDCILSFLNLIRFLCIKDPKAVNESGIWDLKHKLDTQFIEVLRTGIDFSRGHYFAELQKFRNRNCKKKTNRANEKDIFKVEILNDIDDNTDPLTSLPKNHEKQVVVSALQTLELIESVLVRVIEVIG